MIAGRINDEWKGDIMGHAMRGIEAKSVLKSAGIKKASSLTENSMGEHTK
jgi:hypothetical protein